MLTTGRLTRDAEVRVTNANKKVVNFTIAVNDSYYSDGEKKEVTSFIECSYWLGAGVAPFLTKGTTVEVFGRIAARPWVSRDGEPMASLTCHVNNLKLLSATVKTAA